MQRPENAWPLSASIYIAWNISGQPTSDGVVGVSHNKLIGSYELVEPRAGEMEWKVWLYRCRSKLQIKPKTWKGIGTFREYIKTVATWEQTDLTFSL